MDARRQNFWLLQARNFWRGEGFPYPRLSRSEQLREFDILGRTESSILRRDTLRHSTVGLRLANAFHPQMWRMRIHGRSPVDVFRDDVRLARALRKSAQFWPNRRCWNAQCLRSVLRIMHRQRVSNFRPTVAVALLRRYSASQERVLDFSAGFGGRLLGALVVGCNYFGIDPAAAQVSGLRSTIRAFASDSSGQCVITQGCAEEILPSLPSSSFSSVITSPPYFNTERYSDEPTQSFARYPIYEQWRTRFLGVALAESFRILERRGHLLLNVADVNGIAIAADAREICNRYFGSPQKILHMQITRRPTDRGRLPGPYRWEPVFVFRKP